MAGCSSPETGVAKAPEAAKPAASGETASGTEAKPAASETSP